MFFNGQLKTMPPVLRSDDGRNTVIRPLAYCPEAWIVEYAAQMKFPLIPCTLCSTQDHLQRDAMKRLLDGLEQQNPNIRGSAFTAVRNVVTTHLMDKTLYDPTDEEAAAPVTTEQLMEALRV